jgi:hypothetical protein
MKPNVLALAIAGVLFGLSAPVLAQSNSDRSFTHGESKRCESMTGSAKEECDKQEGTKTDGAASGTAASGSERGATGSAAAADGRDGHFTHGESKHCEQLTGAAKEECDKKEATK